VYPAEIAMAALLPTRIFSKADSWLTKKILAQMNWIPLTSEAQLDSISEHSFDKPQVIFKHSTTCSISNMALSRMDRSDFPASIDFYLLDLKQYRSISNQIAEKFQVHHESPQVLLIKKGECIYDESHYGIQMDELVEQSAH
jgi:bacillithiol system protein YtxJ